MANQNWKKDEAKVAKAFGCRRRPGSGSFAHRSGKDEAGNLKEDGADDCDHPDLFVEVKRRDSSFVWNLYDKAKSQADNEQRAKGPRGPRTPVVCFCRPKTAGFLLVVHSDDMEAVLRAIIAKGASTGVPVASIDNQPQLPPAYPVRYLTDWKRGWLCYCKNCYLQSFKPEATAHEPPSCSHCSSTDVEIMQTGKGE